MSRTATTSTTQHRAEFDAVVTFTNGGDLQVRAFRLDVPSDRTDGEEVGRLLVRHLGLLMVGDVEVRDLRIIDEPHKGSRGGPSDPAEAHADVVAASDTERFVDLSHTIVEGMVTYPGLPGPSIRDHLSREASRDHYAEGVEFAIQTVEMVGNTGTYIDSPSTATPMAATSPRSTSPTWSTCRRSSPGSLAATTVASVSTRSVPSTSAAGRCCSTRGGIGTGRARPSRASPSERGSASRRGYAGSTAATR